MTSGQTATSPEQEPSHPARNPRRSLADVMRDNPTPTGFDYLRIGLALCVVVIHSFRITQGPDYFDTAFPLFLLSAVDLILPMFFAVSGFLVTASLLRLNNLPKFLAFRALRIFPALMVVVPITAFVLGPMVTTLPVADYFTSAELWRFCSNMLGIITPELPGVFQTNPVTDVNGSLWTVPHELECYIVLSVLSLLTVVQRPWLILAFILLWGVYISFTTYMDHGQGLIEFTPRTVLQSDIHVSRLLAPSFLAGTVIYVFRQKLAFSRFWGLGSLGLSLILLSHPVTYGLSALPAAYFTVWLGLQNLPNNRLLRSGDYSYSLYVYAYPIQQTVMWLAEPTKGIGATVLGNLVLSLLAASFFVAFSWHCVEKPALKLKKRLAPGVKKALDA